MRNWQEAPIVTIPPPIIPRALCPSCGSTSQVIIRSMPRETDGSQTRLVVCGDCSEPFKVVIDPDCDLEFSSDWKVATPHRVN